MKARRVNEFRYLQRNILQNATANIFVVNLTSYSTDKIIAGIERVFGYLEAGDVEVSTTAPDQNNLLWYQSVAVIGDRGAVASYINGNYSTVTDMGQINSFADSPIPEQWPEVSPGQIIAVDGGKTGQKAMSTLFAMDSDIYEKIGALVMHGFGHNGGFDHDGHGDGFWGILNKGNSLKGLTNGEFPRSEYSTPVTIKELYVRSCGAKSNLGMISFIINRLWKR